ncbi:MAG: hypothetical protein GXP22_03255 [Gammaproteobacteria bacterium]|nr:hypothetical protein [Gammaproteobacteria bacterium]
MNKQFKNLFKILLIAVVLTGCAGQKTFHEFARAGDTIALAAGWQQKFSRDNITVSITDVNGVNTVYAPGNLSVRGAINFYPDPLSSMIVSRETGQDLTTFAQTYAQTITANFTAGDRDWWQTTVFIDLPVALAEGVALIEITNPEGEYASSTVDIVAGTGSNSTFEATYTTPLDNIKFKAMERMAHATINFSATTIPHAVELIITHDPDANNGGAGIAYVSNPRGDVKNLLWTDDGLNTHVIITPVNNVTLGAMQDFKFYIAGGVTNLNILSVNAFDNAGVPVIGVSASIN